MGRPVPRVLQVRVQDDAWDPAEALLPAWLSACPEALLPRPTRM